MSWLSEIFTNSVGTVVEKAGEAIDRLVTSDQEKLQLKNELVKIELDAKAQTESVDLQYEQEVTKRWQSDNEHIVTRLTRPVGFAYTLVMFTLIVIADGNMWSFSIKEVYIPVFETLLVTMVIALYGSRGAEKVAKFIKGGK